MMFPVDTSWLEAVFSGSGAPKYFNATMHAKGYESTSCSSELGSDQDGRL